MTIETCNTNASNRNRNSSFLRYLFLILFYTHFHNWLINQKVSYKWVFNLKMCNYFSIIFVDHMTHGMINMISKVIGIFGVKVLLERLDTNLVSYCVSCYCCKTREYTRAATFTSCLLECDIWKPSMLTINSSRYHYWIHCVLASIGQVNVQFVR